MSRGVGELELVQGLVPEGAAVVVALLTQLGATWFLALLLTALYRTGAASREGVATVAGVGLGGVGLYRGLKAVFALPRPDEPLVDPTVLPELARPLYGAAATAGGYGFPSGHATSATVVYFGLAAVLTVPGARRRFAAAGGIVATVCFTRVALGVHYLVDVVAGVLIGGAFLGASLGLSAALPADRPTVTFGTAIPLSGFYLAASGGRPAAVALAAAALGAFGAWRLVGTGGR